MDTVLSYFGGLLGGPKPVDNVAVLKAELKEARYMAKNAKRLNSNITWHQRKLNDQVKEAEEKEKQWQVKEQRQKWEVEALQEQVAWQDKLLQKAQKDRTVAVLLCTHLSKERAQMEVGAQDRPAAATSKAGAVDFTPARIAELEKAVGSYGIQRGPDGLPGGDGGKAVGSGEARANARGAGDRIIDLGRRVAALESELSAAGAAETCVPTTAEAVAEHLAAAATLQMELAAVSKSVAVAGARAEAAVATLKQLASANAAIGRDVAQLGSCAVEPCRALEVVPPVAAVEGGCCASPRLSEELPSGLACAVGESPSPAVSAGAAHAPAPAPIATAAAGKVEAVGPSLSPNDSCSVLRPRESGSGQRLRPVA
ncbi:hypothetical protein FOA52_003029 [Chlamydomonas sp. UWO 241]|nr:hypothetical protein FOA52_003029 [Chlamydomonas sp. UWO 241]